jgi:hypothetical protein
LRVDRHGHEWTRRTGSGSNSLGSVGRDIEYKEQTVARPEGMHRQIFFVDLDGYAWEFCECAPAMLAD